MNDGTVTVGRARVRTVLAPAKLTVSLRVTGVRPDGYHELDAEMLTLSLADQLQLDEGGSGLVVDVEPGVRSGGLPGPGQNLVEQALVACGRRAAVHLTKRIPLGGGLGGGSADAAAVLRWAGCTDPDVAVRLGADVPFCLVGGGPASKVWGRRSPPSRSRPGSTSCSCRPSAWRRPGSTGPGTRIPVRRGRTRSPRRRWPSSRGWDPGVTPWGSGPGASRCWPGAARRGSSRAGHRPGRSVPDELRIGAETARLVRARTVPAGWEGD